MGAAPSGTVRAVAAVLDIAGLDAVEHVGSDGFVTTYRAHDVELGQAVTVEVLPPVSGSEEALGQYELTLRALYAKPRHRAILPIHELGQLEDGRPYVITLGSTVRTLADHQVSLGSEEVVAVGVTLADALAVAHERGVVHGDVRLEHVRLTEQGEPVLSAFGYDRLARTLRTRRDNLVTSLTNASPEILSGCEPDAAADAWALACCLHQLLVGRSPFGLTGNPSLPEIVDRVLNQPLEDLRAAGVADDLATVLEAALQRDRSSRLTTAASLRRALEGVGRIHGQPREQKPTTPEPSETPVGAAGPVPFNAGMAPPPPGMMAPEAPAPEPGGAGAAEQARANRQIVILLGIAAVLLVILTISILSLVG